MSSLVTQEYWTDMLGDMPMPEGATPEMVWAAIEAMQQLDEIDEALKNVKTYQKMRDYYVNSHGGIEDSDAVKWYDEIIDFYRGKLNG